MKEEKIEEKKLEEWFDSLVSELIATNSFKEWNKKIAPILRKKGAELGIKWLQNNK